MTDQRFPPRYRLRKGREFERVFQRRCTARDGRLLVFACENDLDHPRLGMAVSRKVGPAVVRNRWKRLIREAFRLRREELPRHCDLVVIPASPEKPRLADVARSLVQLAGRAARKLSRS